MEVPERSLTAVYRSHSRGAQLKRIRRAVGSGTRLRVDEYGDRRVIEAIASADVVFFALDSRIPVLEAFALKAVRGDDARRLLVVDFNTFGSTDGLGSVDGVQLIDAARLETGVARFSEALCGCPAFTHAADEAATWIQQRLHEDEDAMTAEAQERRNGHCRSCRSTCDLRTVIFHDSLAERTTS
jgi:hypothetical protein